MVQHLTGKNKVMSLILSTKQTNQYEVLFDSSIRGDEQDYVISANQLWSSEEIHLATSLGS